MQHNPGLATSAAAGGGQKAQSSSAGTQEDGQLWNPPMVHALALPWCLPHGHHSNPTAAAGHGSGGGASSSCSSKAPGAAAAAVKAPAIPAAVLKRLVAVARGDGVVAVIDADPDAKPSQSTTTGKAAAAQQQQQRQVAPEVSPGCHVWLGPSLGGHTLPAAAVVFMPWGGGARYLVSAGQDGRLILWDWTAAFTAAPADDAGGNAAVGDCSVESAATDSVLLRKGGKEAQAGPAQSAAAAEAAPAAAAAAQQTGAGATAGVSSRSSPCLLLEKEHKRKVNALCCCWAPTAPVGGGGNPAVTKTQDAGPVLVLVADTASRITVYRVKL